MGDECLGVMPMTVRVGIPYCSVEEGGLRG